jgi:hypothetical protein
MKTRDMKKVFIPSFLCLEATQRRTASGTRLTPSPRFNSARPLAWYGVALGANIFLSVHMQKNLVNKSHSCKKIESFAAVLGGKT